MCRFGQSISTLQIGVGRCIQWNWSSISGFNPGIPRIISRISGSKTAQKQCLKSTKRSAGTVGLGEVVGGMASASSAGSRGRDPGQGVRGSSKLFNCWTSTRSGKFAFFAIFCKVSKPEVAKFLVRAYSEWDSFVTGIWRAALNHHLLIDKINDQITMYTSCNYKIAVNWVSSHEYEAVA